MIIQFLASLLASACARSTILTSFSIINNQLMSSIMYSFLSHIKQLFNHHEPAYYILTSILTSSCHQMIGQFSRRNCSTIYTSEPLLPTESARVIVVHAQMQILRSAPRGTGFRWHGVLNNETTGSYRIMTYSHIANVFHM